MVSFENKPSIFILPLIISAFKSYFIWNVINLQLYFQIWPTLSTLMCTKEFSMFRRNGEHNWYSTMATHTRQTKNPFPGNDHETGSVRCIIVANVERGLSPETSTALKQSAWLYISIHIHKCILIIRNFIFYRNQEIKRVFSDQNGSRSSVIIQGK